jgi:hypothetical protein
VLVAVSEVMPSPSKSPVTMVFVTLPLESYWNCVTNPRLSMRVATLRG